MGVFDRFRRNRQQSVLPDEVKQYYQTENRQRRGVAALLAVIALIVTVAIAAGLFFGGRFVYDKIKGDDTNNAQSTSEENKPDEQPNNNPASENETETPTATSAPAATPTPAPAPAPATTPALGDNPALPHTGDPGM